MLSDYFHVRCFEHLVDLSNPIYLERLLALTCNVRGLRETSPAAAENGWNFVDCGAERLILEWKCQRKRWIVMRAGEITVAPSSYDPDFWNMYYNAGCAWFIPPDQYLTHRFMLPQLAPVETGGFGDLNEWRLFREYLPDSSEEHFLDDRHHLSQVLEDWAAAQVTMVFFSSYFSYTSRLLGCPEM